MELYTRLYTLSTVLTVENPVDRQDINKHLFCIYLTKLRVYRNNFQKLLTIQMSKSREKGV